MPALAENALTTTELARKRVGVTGSGEDDLLNHFINFASDRIETYCGRKFKKQQYSGEKHSGQGRQFLVLKNYPIVSIDEIKVDGNVINTTTSDFFLDAEAGMLHNINGWVGGIVNTAWLDVEVNSQAQRFNIEAKYTAGYVLPQDEAGQIVRTLPRDLEEACILLVKEAYLADKNQNLGIKQEVIGGYSVTYQDTSVKNSFPIQVLDILNSYRRESF